MVAVLCINISACQRPDNTTSKTGTIAKSNQKGETKTEKIGDDREANKENTERKEGKQEEKGLDDKQKVSRVDVPKWSEDAVLYEVNIRQYTKEGTFKAFEEHLPRLKELGVDILWFMPIHPISEENRKGTLGSYYSVQDYRDVNPEFGILEEFKDLVDRCHEMGFKVLLDWVGNHTGWDNPWIENKDWYTQNAKGEIIHPPSTDWTDVADLNYDNQDMCNAMLDAMKFWVEEVGVDGFRADYASGVPDDFWEHARSELDRIKPIYMLAEDEGRLSLLDEAFNANYGWELHHIMNKVAKGQNNARHVAINLQKTQDIYPQGTYPMNFTSNHDENSWSGTVYERLGDAVETMAVLTFTVPGIPLIYSGQEAGLDKRLEFFEKDEIDWSNLEMQEFYRALIILKKQNPALWNGDAGGEIDIIEPPDNNLLVFVREKDDNKVVVIMNLSESTITSNVEFGDVAGDYESYFSGEVFTVEERQSLKMNPWEYMVLTSK